MKRELIFIFITLTFMSLVSADPVQEGIRISQGVIDGFIGITTPFFEFIIGDYSSNEFFATKVLMLILLFVIINAIFTKINFSNSNPSVSKIIAGAISIISIRFISENELVLGILLPYGTLGIVILTSLVLITIFYFINITNMGSIGRRLIWSFFGLVYIVLFLSRYDDLNPITKNIYGWSIALIIFFIIFDRGIHRYFAAWELNTFYRGANQRTVAALQAEYLNIISVNTPQAEARRRAIEHQLTNLGARVP